MTKNADVLLVREYYAKEKRKVEEMEVAMEGLSVKLAIAKLKVDQVGNGRHGDGSPQG